MRRIDRTRWERRRKLMLAMGLSFALGALTAGALIWRVQQLESLAAADAHPTGELDSSSEDPKSGAPPAPVPTATAGSDDSATDDIQALRARHLEMPVDGIAREQLRDSFDERRSGIRRHEALDIMAPRGTPTRAVENGRVAKLFTSVAGGLTLYLFDPSETFCYYYAHLDRYRDGLREGQTVRRGELIGYVGSSGNAAEDAPHLHFAVFRLPPDKKWWQGEPINPYPVLR